MYKWYLIVVSVVVATIMLFGFILPALVSAENDMALMLAAIIYIILPMLGIALTKYVYKHFERRFENNQKDIVDEKH